MRGRVVFSLSLLALLALFSPAFSAGNILRSTELLPDFVSSFLDGDGGEASIEAENEELANFSSGLYLPSREVSTHEGLQTAPGGEDLGYAAVLSALEKYPLLPGSVAAAEENSAVDSTTSRSLQTTLPRSWGNTFPITRNNLLGTITVPASYVIQFDFFPTPQADSSWRNILHMTQGGDCCYGNRLPGIWLCHGQAGCVDKGAILVHYFGFANGGGTGFFTRQTIPQNQWTTIKIMVDADARYMGFEASGAWGSFKQGSSFPGVNNLPSFNGVKVWASDPWYVPAAGQLRNVQLSQMPSTPALSFPVGMLGSSIPGAAPQRVRMGNLLARVNVPRSFVLSFDVFPLPDPNNNWRNVILMTNGMGAWAPGQRMPGEWMDG